MYERDLDGDIELLRWVRWLFLRLPIFILAVRGCTFIKEGRTPKGILELGIAAALIILDLFILGRSIRRMKKQLKDPEFWKKENAIPLEDKVRRDARFAIRFGIGWTLVCIGLFIIFPIAASVDDLAVCLVFGALLAAFGLFFLVKGIRQYKKADQISKEIKDKEEAARDDGILYKDYELGFEPAQVQYCKQTGKSEEDLTEADEDIIWEHAYAQITYLLAWIAEHDFYAPQEGDSAFLEEIIADVKARKKSPSFYIAENDGTLFKANIKPEAIGFVKEYMNNSEYVNGHEVAKPGDIIGAYYPEVEAFAKEHLNAEMFGFPFRWEDYDCFKENIDKAYEKYLNRESGLTV